ncbi:MAG TPA: hypothetical protein VFY69_03315 [Solirubrobacterales bacterium]|nr:hypothetical protein [Solirubrobacterales bacterium]
MEPEVLPRDPHPLVILRRGEHLPDELVVVRLDPSTLLDGEARLGDPGDEAVANRLELAEVENPRRGRDGIDPVGDLGMAEGLGEEARQLALQARDLPAQLQPRVALVSLAWKPGELVLSQQSGHG